MDLRAPHHGYAYQDLLTAVRLVDVLLGTAATVLVDTKVREGDRFDDITTEWASGGRQRIQIKHTAVDKPLTKATFSADKRDLRLDLIIKSAAEDLQAHPDTTYRILLRDTEPDDEDLVAVLRPVDAAHDPGPALRGVTSTRMRFAPDELQRVTTWRKKLSGLDEAVVHAVCTALIVEVGLPACSLDILDPGPAEQALLRRASDELGAGRPPNVHRSPEDVGRTLIQAANRARSLNGTVTSEDLTSKVDLIVDFGAVNAGHPVDAATAIPRPVALDTVAATIDERAATGGTVVITGGPGVGKSWLCEQLADRLRSERWIVGRHHCWLGVADAHRGQRVLTEVVIGSLLNQLEAAAPTAISQLRPRFAATRETLTAAIAAVRTEVPEQPLVLIVDGLDHVTRVLGPGTRTAFSEPRDPASMLVDELTALELPSGTVLVLASQPGVHLEPATITVPLPPLTRAEVQRLAERLDLPAAFSPNPTGDERINDRVHAAIDLIHTRSRGNALYATYLCRQALGPLPAIAAAEPNPTAHEDPLDRLQDVPSTAEDLNEYYGYLFRPLTDRQQDAVRLLAICDFGVTLEELGEIFPQVGLTPPSLTAIAPIIVQQPGVGGLRIHHESFSRFIREHTDAARIAAVRGAAVAWLTKRGFFTDLRAFRHLPELLVDLRRDSELSRLICPEFVTRAVAGLQPPAAMTHVLTVTARRAATRLDWPLLVRCVELRRAAYNYEVAGLSETLVDYASVVVALVGADKVAASLIYDGVPTVDARWGLHLCAAVDNAGAAAPWEAYLDEWEQPGRRDNTDYGQERDDELALVRQLGYLRLPKRPRPDRDSSTEDNSASREQQLAVHLESEDLPPLPRLLDVFITGLGAPFVLAAARLVSNPRRRAEILLHLADVAAVPSHGLPASRALAVEAWESSPTTDPIRMVHHGIPVADVVSAAIESPIDEALQELTTSVLHEDTATLQPEVVRKWLTLLVLSHAITKQAPLQVLPRLAGEGFYRAWLRFAATTVGLHQDVAAGSTTPEDASTTVRVALEHLAQNAQPFTGKPRACDLGWIHSLIQDVLEDAIQLTAEPDLDDVLHSLVAISDGTTTSAMGLAGSGPLTITALLTILSRTVDHTGAEAVQRLMDQLRTERENSSIQYPEFAHFELEMSRISLAAGDRDEAIRCWQRSAHYSACYGHHKDLTLLELLDPLPTLASADMAAARSRLAKTRDLTYLVRHHTDGRETNHLPRHWWELLADLHPEAAAVFAAQLLLDEPDLEDTHAEAAHQRLLQNQPPNVDPVVLAALRIAAGPRGRDLDADLTLLDKLHSLPPDDSARTSGVLPVLANAITATYDDQPLLYASGDENGPAPTAALSDAAIRLGGDGVPPYQVKPRHNASSQQAPPRRRNNRAGFQSGAQRPELQPGIAGVISAVRRYANSRYGTDDNTPSWDTDAITNIVGWQLLATAGQDGADAAIRLLHRVTEEFSGLADSTALAHIATGLDQRRAANHEQLDRLTSTAYVLAFTKIRGGGGWKNFAGRDRLDLWERAAAIDAATAATVLANQVVARLEGQGYETSGIPEALIAAFATRSPDLELPQLHMALACWDAAFDIIAYRIPGTIRSCSEAYAPETSLTAQIDVNVAMTRLALATIALPTRADRRRALVAATVLLAARPTTAQAAMAHVLTADLGAGPLTWLLHVLRDNLDDYNLVDALKNQLVVLARYDLLSVRVLAAEILEAAGHDVPAPPATTAHPSLSSAVADALHEES